MEKFIVAMLQVQILETVFFSISLGWEDCNNFKVNS